MNTVEPLGPRLREALRRVGAEVASLAWSVDGVSFGFQAPVSDSPASGSWVQIRSADRVYLGYVTEVVVEEAQPIEVEATQAVDADLGVAPIIRAQVAYRRARGVGTLLTRVEADEAFIATQSSDTFDESVIAPANGAVLDRYLARLRAGQPRLCVGTADYGRHRAPALVDPRGVNRHAFLCGQSGSGKSYALGVLLERLLAETALRLVVLDPNGDFVRLGQVAEGVGPGREADRLTQAAGALRVFGVDAADPDRLRIRADDLAPAELAALARLDPVTDRDEYALFVDLLAEGARNKAVADLSEIAALGSPEAVALATRLRNLGVFDWRVWARGGASVVATLDQPRGSLVADLSGLDSDPERWVTAHAFLTHLWEHRKQRRPTLIVVDEAHNLCPAQAAPALLSQLAERFVQIAAEGRKYGIYLLMATQRPSKVHPNVVTQAENLVLLKVNSAADRAELATAFSHIPPALVHRAGSFRRGEALVGGPMVEAPMLLQFGGRLSAEPGGDVPSDWATSPWA